MLASAQAAIAKSISRGGPSVVQAGFDEFGSLVRVSTIDGKLDAPVREPPDVIVEERLKRWAVDFPYAYGIDDDWGWIDELVVEAFDFGLISEVVTETEDWGSIA